MRRLGCFGAGYYLTTTRRFDMTEVPVIEPQTRVVSYVEKAEKSQSLHWFMIGLALYVSYSLGCAVSKPEIFVGAYGTVYLNGEIISTCDESGHCEYTKKWCDEHIGVCQKPS